MEETHVTCDVDSNVEVLSSAYEGWGKLPLHTVDTGRTMAIATAASWLVNWILLFSKIAVVIISNSKAVSSSLCLSLLIHFLCS